MRNKKWETTPNIPSTEIPPIPAPTTVTVKSNLPAPTTVTTKPTATATTAPTIKCN